MILNFNFCTVNSALDVTQQLKNTERTSNITLKTCCYDKERGLFADYLPITGGLLIRHPQFEREHIQLDVQPKQWCCNGSDLCDLYTELHPAGSCYEHSSYTLGG